MFTDCVCLHGLQSPTGGVDQTDRFKLWYLRDTTRLELLAYAVLIDLDYEIGSVPSEASTNSLHTAFYQSFDLSVLVCVGEIYFATPATKSFA